MSSTRHSTDPTVFKQDRFASSTEFQRGLLGNLVARRSTVLNEPRERELVMHLQCLSHRPGGLVAVTGDLLRRFPERFTTANMRRFGIEHGQYYKAAQVNQIRDELGFDGMRHFPLHTDREGYPGEHLWRDRDPRQSYPAAEFLAYCQEQARERLPALLAEFCLDPAFDPALLTPCNNPWVSGPDQSRSHPWCPDLLGTLYEYQKALAAEAMAPVVETEISRRTIESLDYALEGTGIVIIEGRERIGKTFPAKAWCEARPGIARYVEVPSNPDEACFFRAIADSLGVASGSSLKAAQIRARIESTIGDARMTLCMDEGHQIFARPSRSVSRPSGRVCWIISALANRKIPCAVVATPQFTLSQREMEVRTRWRSGQFIGRVAHYERLPETLSMADLINIARAYLPDAEMDSVRGLANLAKISRRGLGLLEFVVNRARFEVHRAGRKTITAADLARVIKSQALPTDGILAELVGQAIKAAPVAPGTQSPSRGPRQVSTDSPAEQAEGRSAGRRGLQPAGRRSRSATVDLVTA